MDCPDCKNHIPAAMPQCPHCGRPGYPPNLREASEPHEIDAVVTRYEKALAKAEGRGCGDVARHFEILAANAQAIIGRSVEEAQRLATSDNEGYAPFWKLLHAGVRFPASPRWDRLRGLADWELFGAARDEMRFAALSSDGSWAKNYGAVALELAEAMIAHRATVFEENSALFFERCRRNGEEPPLVAGYRARWCDRGKLALAKHQEELRDACTDADLHRLLLRSGASSSTDVFVEVHIFGSVTRRTLRRVIIDRAQVSEAIVLDLRERLEKAHVAVDEG